MQHFYCILSPCRQCCCATKLLTTTQNTRISVRLCNKIFILLLLCLNGVRANTSNVPREKKSLTQTLNKWYNSANNKFNTCFSCMDYELKYYWWTLKHVYKQPLNYTIRCGDLAEPIGTVHCETGACVTIVEPQYVAGYRVGETVIRGCSSNLFIGGEIPDDVMCTKYELTRARCSSCRRVVAHEIMPPAARAMHKSNRNWLLCSCVGNNCNRSPLFRRDISGTNNSNATFVIDAASFVLTSNWLLCWIVALVLATWQQRVT